MWNLTTDDLRKRLYFVRKTSNNGQTTFQFHQEARNDDQLKEDYRKEHGEEPLKSLTNGESSIDFDQLPIPKFLLSPVNMKMMIEGTDFELASTGKIKRLKGN